MRGVLESDDFFINNQISNSIQFMDIGEVGLTFNDSINSKDHNQEIGSALHSKKKIYSPIYLILDYLG